MGVLDQVVSAKQRSFRRVCLFARHGWGKNTWASQWPKPIFLRTEDGCGHLDVPTFPLCKTFLDVSTIVMELATASELPYSTLVIDSADWTEQLIWREVEEAHEVSTIAEIEFGKGYEEARKKFRVLLGQLDLLHERMHVVWLAHQQMVLVKRTDGTEYHQYQPKLRQRSADDLMEWCDEVLHGDIDVTTRKANPKAIGNQTSVGVSLGRVLYTRESPQRLAKSRLLINGQPIPEKIEVADDPSSSFQSFRAYLKGAMQ